MVGRGGIPRIQEDTGDTVKVYSAQEWKDETEKRLRVEKENAGKPDDVETDTKLPDEQDSEETETAPVEKPEKSEPKLGKAKKGKGK